jgi:putative glycosyltransferase (TIGR04348 family)
MAKVCIACPAPRGSRTGNRVTALRWAGLLRGLGHGVRVLDPWPPQPPVSPTREPGPSHLPEMASGPRSRVGLTGGCNLLVALHAVKSAPAVADFKRRFPDRPAAVALTGTDIFQDGSTAAVLADTLRLADRVIALQNQMAAAVPAEHRHKVRVIFQSFTPPDHLPTPRTDRFDVCVLGHLRAVKDPLLAAEAVRDLPPESRLHVVQVGGVLEAEYAERARREQESNPRYEWRGELPRAEAVRALAGCRLLVMSSRSEGGPSAVSEAVACGVPVVSTPTSGVVGLLGEDYPGYFPVGDAATLQELLLRCERDPPFLNELRSACDRVRPLIAPATERAAWVKLLAELGGASR